MQKCKKRKKHKKYRSTKIKNTWAPAFSTKKQNRVKTQKAKNYKNAKNVKNTKSIKTKMQNKLRQLLVLEYLYLYISC